VDASGSRSFVDFNINSRRLVCAILLILLQNLDSFRGLAAEKKKFGCSVWINIVTPGVKFLGNGPLMT
jgi:hypothetical protein